MEYIIYCSNIVQDLRQKYLLFAFLAFANLFNTLFMLIDGNRRRYFIFTNQIMQLRSSFECLQYPGPHLLILGNQLPALIILVIDIERLIAVYRYDSAIRIAFFALQILFFI
jgi:hypothetical protein